MRKKVLLQNYSFVCLFFPCLYVTSLLLSSLLKPLLYHHCIPPLYHDQGPRERPGTGGLRVSPGGPGGGRADGADSVATLAPQQGRVRVVVVVYVHTV